jgi:hypothetical protein
MSKTFKIPFAFTKEGEVMDIENAEKGKTYLCSCGADVKLRGGEIRSNHFYHLNESECSLESSIHKAYKAVFQSTKKIKLPYEINGVEELVFDRVELEKKIDDYVPDAIGYIGDKMYLIEFAKTSFIGVRKEQKVKKSNLFCLEVHIMDTIKTIADIENHLSEEIWYKHTIHIPEYEEMRNMREKFKAAYLKLQQDNEKLAEEVWELKQQNDQLANGMLEREIKGLPGLALYYSSDCKNGAKLYKRGIGQGREIVGFEKNGVFNIKYN